MTMNESELVEREITIRNLALTKEVTETRRALIRWLALALGVINPGESRQSAIAVLDSIMYFQFNQKKDPDVGEMMSYIGAAWEPINEKTLRYHLLQLNKANIVKHSKGKYFLTHPDGAAMYDCEAWITNYFNTEINPIRDKLVVALKELKER